MNHTQLHAYLVTSLDEIRTRFAEADLGYFRLDIECTGHTHGTHDTKIAYKLSSSSYGDADSATAARLDRAIEEHLRRKGWSQANDPERQITHQQ
jgi:hypothetical protein